MKGTNRNFYKVSLLHISTKGCKPKNKTKMELIRNDNKKRNSKVHRK